MAINSYLQGAGGGNVDTLVKKINKNAGDIKTNITNISNTSRDLTAVKQYTPRKDKGIYIPFYQNPINVYSNTEVEKVVELARDNYKEFSVVVVINPASGAGSQANQNYQALIDLVIGAGGYIIGYVSTAYGTRASVDVLAEIDTWYEFYPNIQGIFLDEFPDDSNLSDIFITKYKEYYQKVKSKGINQICDTNPGVYVEEGLKYQGEIFDKILTWENSGFPSENQALGGMNSFSARNYPASARVAVVHSQASYSKPDVKNLLNWFGYIFLTQDILPNPFDVSTNYYNEMVISITNTTAISNIEPAGLKRDERGGIINDALFYTAEDDFSGPFDPALYGDASTTLMRDVGVQKRAEAKLSSILGGENNWIDPVGIGSSILSGSGSVIRQPNCHAIGRACSLVNHPNAIMLNIREGGQRGNSIDNEICLYADNGVNFNNAFRDAGYIFFIDGIVRLLLTDSIPNSGEVMMEITMMTTENNDNTRSAIDKIYISMGLDSSGNTTFTSTTNRVLDKFSTFDITSVNYNSSTSTPYIDISTSHPYSLHLSVRVFDGNRYINVRLQ